MISIHMESGIIVQTIRSDDLVLKLSVGSHLILSFSVNIIIGNQRVYNCEKTVVDMYTVQALRLLHSCEIGKSLVASQQLSGRRRYAPTDQRMSTRARILIVYVASLAAWCSHHWPAQDRSAGRRVYHHIIVINHAHFTLKNGTDPTLVLTRTNWV